jgi:hypothetical protein
MEYLYPTILLIHCPDFEDIDENRSRQIPPTVALPFQDIHEISEEPATEGHGKDLHQNRIVLRHSDEEESSQNQSPISIIDINHRYQYKRRGDEDENNQSTEE